MAAVVFVRIHLKTARSLTWAIILLVPADAVRQCFNEDAAFARRLAGPAFIQKSAIALPGLSALM